MTKQLESQLRAAHPAMLADLEYGFEHGDGWFRVVSRLCELLEPYGVRLTQVKQKLGLLRVYTDSDHDDEIRDIVADAERRSRHICETCGFGDFSGLSGDCLGCWK